MNTRLATLAGSLLLMAMPSVAQENPKNEKEQFQKAFTEEFSKSRTKIFYERRDKGTPETDFRYSQGVPSATEKGTKVLLYRIDPNGPVGAGRGPEIVSKRYTTYGSYSARFRVPDVTRVQPNVGAVVGYFTYNDEPGKSLSEIDIEILIADPRIIYIGTWTGKDGKLQRVGRIVNLATGEILDTSYHGPQDGDVVHNLTGAQAQPSTIPAIKGFDASKQFYTYGFDWHPDRIVWWIEHPETGERVILWDYHGSTPHFTGIPDNRTYYRLNFWHTNNWPVETNPKSLEKPKYPFELECDWMSYKPFGQYNK